MTQRSTYSSFTDLPRNIRTWLLDAYGIDEAEGEAFVRKTIPALNHKSILQTMNAAGGELEVIDLIKRVAGKF